MARTANRYLKAQPLAARSKEIFLAGNYLRLSVDSDYTGSDSLENQRKLAKEYAEKNKDVSIVMTENPEPALIARHLRE